MEQMNLIIHQWSLKLEHIEPKQRNDKRIN